MSSVNATNGTAQYGGMLMLGAAVAAAAVSALYVCGKRYTHKPTQGQKVAAIAQASLGKIIKNRVVTRVQTTEISYKYQQGLRDVEGRTVTAVFYLTVANSRSLTGFLHTDARAVQWCAEQRSHVTDFEIQIASLDNDFAAPQLAQKLIERFPNLRSVSLVAPEGTTAMGPLRDFIQPLAAKNIHVTYEVAPNEISAK